MARSPLARAVLAALLAAGCARRGPDLSKPVPGVSGDVVLAGLDHDVDGRPLLTEPLERRPKEAGEQFTVVHLLNGRPDVSYDVVVVRAADFEKPLKVIYHWTGRGFRIGLQKSIVLLATTLGAADSRLTVAALEVVVAPMATGAATGAAIGAVISAPDMGRALAAALRGRKERLVSFTTYDYDELARLVKTRMYSGDGRQELIRTEYLYAAGSYYPFKTLITDARDGRPRIFQ